MTASLDRYSVLCVCVGLSNVANEPHHSDFVGNIASGMEYNFDFIFIPMGKIISLRIFHFFRCLINDHLMQLAYKSMLLHL